ncbi:unnamed protein product [Brassica oleracea]
MKEIERMQAVNTKKYRFCDMWLAEERHFCTQLKGNGGHISNRASWSGGKGTSAEVPAITTSSPGHSGFNIPSVGALDPLRG